MTGISGGGAATFWIAAADERLSVAVPVSGMADLPSYVGNRVINGHCDCMFLYNTFQWPWTRIAALIAPRPQLFVNSDADRIFLIDANPPSLHMSPDAQQFLNVPHVCDIPEALDFLAPRTLTITGGEPIMMSKVEAIYAAADAPDRLSKGN